MTPLANKKDTLLEQEKEAPIVLVDEKGKALTEEEAREEEERLNASLELYFSANPTIESSYKADEESDEEEVTVTVNDHGEVTKEEIIKQGEIKKEEVLLPAGPSFVEEEILKQVISKHIKFLEEEYDTIMKVEGSFFAFSEGSTLFDNIVDAYRKERNELHSLFFNSPVSLENLSNETLKRALEQETKDFISSMFNLVQELAPKEKM